MPDLTAILAGLRYRWSASWDDTEVPESYVRWLNAQPSPAPRRPKRRFLKQSVRRFVLRRDANCCVKCGSQEELEMDHIIPWSQGGDDRPENLQTLCGPCNYLKGPRGIKQKPTKGNRSCT